MKNTLYLSSSLVVFILLALLVLTQAGTTDIAMAQKATAIPTVMSDTTVGVFLSNPIVQPGEEFDILVNITTDTPTWASQLILSYDPAQIEVLDVSEGDFYSQWAEANGIDTFVLPSDPDNEIGQAVYAITLLSAPQGQGPTGEGTLVSYRAIAKDGAEGEFELVLEEVIVTDAADNEALQTQMLGGLKIQNGLLVIGGAVASAPEQPTAAALPSDTPRPTPTPEATIARIAVDAEGNPQIPGTGATQGGGIPWIIIIPVLGALVIGVVVFVLSRRK